MSADLFRRVVVGAVLLATSAAARAQGPGLATYYSMNPYPAVRIQTGPRDVDVPAQLQLNVILAVLKHELSVERNFTDLASSTRQQLVAILSDPNMVLDYTGLQGGTTTRGGQAIDENLARFDQAAFYNAEGPRPAHEIAGTILHEIAHIWQLRHGGTIDRLVKERWPTHMEGSLPVAAFSEAALRQAADVMTGTARPEDPTRYVAAVVAWEGTWEVTSHWTKPADTKPVTWQFTVEALEGNKCRIKAGRNQFDGTIEDTTLTWKDPGLGVHRYVNYSFRRNGDELTGTFDGKSRADTKIEGSYTGRRVR